MFQSNSLLREYLYVIMYTDVRAQSFFVSIQLPIKGVFILAELSRKNAVFIVSIQLPIKGVFIHWINVVGGESIGFNPTPY